MLSSLLGECNVFQWTIVSIAAVVLYTVYLNVRNRKLPPHQLILPLVGSLLSLGKKRPGEVVESLRGSDGKAPKMSSFVFPSFTIITVNDLATVKRVFQQESEFTSDRPEAFVQIVSVNCPFGIISAPSPTWIQTRRIGLQILRELGLGKSVLQQSIAEQSEFLQSILSSQVKERGGFDISLTLSRCSSDIMSMMLFGHKPAIEGDVGVKYVELVEQLVAANVLALTIFPSLLYLAPFVPALRKRTDVHAQILAYLKDIIQKHREQLAEVNEPTDFIDHFLLQQEKEKAQGRPVSGKSPYSDENLALSVFDLFIAGTDTTSVTLTWAIALLCHKPHIQDQVHQELISVFGEANLANMSQINDCPYTRAVMSEVLRFGVVVPNSLAHTATRDLMIDEYCIPKDCVLLVNINSLCRDPNVWKHPKEFHPEHFYDVEKKLYLPNENLMNFSIGKRVCLGESLARQELFLFLAAMLMKYRFEFHEKSAPLVEDILSAEEEGLIRRPKRFLVNVFKR